MVVGEGFEPSKAEPADLQSAPFGHSGTQPFLMVSLIFRFFSTPTNEFCWLVPRRRIELLSTE